jgi:hypothetical protein
MLEFRRRRSLLGAFVGCAALVAVGCGGSSFDGHVFREGDLAFRVGPIPPAWRRIDADGALLAFRDDHGEATIALNGRCGLDGDDVPLEALTHHLFLHFTDVTLLKQERFELAGRAAMRSELTAALDGVPMHYVVVVLKKNGCVYDFMLVNAAGTSADQRAFDGFVGGFETLG